LLVLHNYTAAMSLEREPKMALTAIFCFPITNNKNQKIPIPPRGIGIGVKIDRICSTQSHRGGYHNLCHSMR
jgi:hypothetical protein